MVADQAIIQVADPVARDHFLPGVCVLEELDKVLSNGEKHLVLLGDGSNTVALDKN